MPEPIKKRIATTSPPIMVAAAEAVNDSPEKGVLLNNKEAAEYLKISERSLKHRRDKGTLNYIQEGPNCKVFYYEADLKKYLQENRHTPGGLKSGLPNRVPLVSQGLFL